MARMHLQQRRLQDVSDLHDEAGMWSMTVVVTMDLVLHSLQLSALSARSYLLSKVPLISQQYVAIYFCCLVNILIN